MRIKGMILLVSLVLTNSGCTWSMKIVNEHNWSRPYDDTTTKIEIGCSG